MVGGSMTDADFRVPELLEYVAVVAWLTSGAVVGIRKHFDTTGVFVISLLSSTGGGLMRDSLLLQRTPTLITHPVYLILIAVTTVLLTLFAKPFLQIVSVRNLKKTVDLIDAIGIPAFAVVGMQLAEERGIPIAGILFVGLVNGVGGGLLRDIVIREIPSLLRPGQFVTPVLLLSCGMFLLLEHQWGVPPTIAAWSMVTVFFFVRLLAIRFNWNTRPVIPVPRARTDAERRS